MIITFAGSPDGMTPQQRVRIAARLENDPILAAHHGAGIGAEHQFHEFAVHYKVPHIFLYPPLDEALTMDASVGTMPPWMVVTVYAKSRDVERYQSMLASSDALIVTPPQFQPYSSRRERWHRWENVWRAVHYAEVVGIPVHIIYIDGTIEVRD